MNEAEAACDVEYVIEHRRDMDGPWRRGDAFHSPQDAKAAAATEFDKHLRFLASTGGKGRPEVRVVQVLRTVVFIWAKRMTMTKAEYNDYQDRFRRFMQEEGIDNLTSGHVECPECGKEWVDDTCPEHGGRELWDEPWFSHSPCDCCRRPIGGNMVHATGWKPKTKSIEEYAICEDCQHYAAYGRLDDATMAGMD